MTTNNKALTGKLQALNALLDSPRPEEDAWSKELQAALESIYELALRPEEQSSARSSDRAAVPA